MRVAAAQSLRRIDDSRAEQWLSRLAGDADDSVRFSAIDAISERKPSPVLARAVAQLAVGDRSFRSRLRATETAVTWLKASSELKVTLERVAAEDVNPDIRRIARTGLDRAAARINLPHGMFRRDLWPLVLLAGAVGAVGCGETSGQPDASGQDSGSELDASIADVGADAGTTGDGAIAEGAGSALGRSS